MNDKIKVSYAQIFADTIPAVSSEKPYYQIEYHDLSDNEIHIGFGSYDIKWVYQWIAECFEFVPQTKSV